MGPLTDGQMRHASAARGAGLTFVLDAVYRRLPVHISPSRLEVGQEHER
jgi:hypothetical protein